MSKYWSLPVVLVSVALLAGCSKKSSMDSMDMNQPTTMASTYTCTMHPDVAQAQPGKCPKCGMQVVVKK